MSNYNKLNPSQKEVMAEFMASHPSLAKNSLPNCAQGRATASRLWEELSRRLNAVGPPLKDAKIWRKTFADQKYQAKKKLSFNKASKQRTCGSYDEIARTEELIIEAAGLEAYVQGNENVPEFDNVPASTSICESDDSNEEASSSYSYLPGTSTAALSPSRSETSGRSKNPRRTKNSGDEVFALPQKKTDIDGKFDRLLEIHERLVLVQERSVLAQERSVLAQERMLQIKEEKHRKSQEACQIDLQIKRLEMEALKINLKRQSNGHCTCCAGTHRKK